MKEIRIFGKSIPISPKTIALAASVIALAVLIILRILNPSPPVTSAADSWALGNYSEAGDTVLTRGMLAMALYELSGRDFEDVGNISLSDVSDSSCYKTAAQWAVFTGIMTTDENGDFSPRAAVSRESMLCALWRYAGFAGLQPESVSADISRFRDSGLVSDYAMQAMRWAVGAGVTVGWSEDSLNPAGDATAAQLTAAVIRMYNGRWDVPERAALFVSADSAFRSYLENVRRVSFLSVGDNLYHSPVISSGKQADGSLNYDDIYSEIREYVQAADLASINQETMFVSDPGQYSGYPTFGTPYAVAESIARTGFDIVTQASNHTLDKGVSAITEAAAYWRVNYPEIAVLGIHEAPESRVKFIEKNGIRFALLCYTYGLNGLILPSGYEYAVDLLTLGENAIASDMAEAEAGADCTIVFMHAGTEYVYTPNPDQLRWAQFFADHGAEAIIGTHPHVLEPLKLLQSADGRTVPCYYSLGNLVSNQQEYPRWLGGMAQFDVVMDGGVLSIENVSLKATFTHIYNRGGASAYKAYVLDDYTPQLAAQHMYGYMFGSSVDAIWNLYNQITAG